MTQDMKTFPIIVLLLSGLALSYASASRLFDPAAAVFLQTFFENPTHSLEVSTDLVNEIRGIGTVMLLAGVVAIIGVFRPAFRVTALTVTTVIFVGVALGRAISMGIDGMPPPELMRVFMIEGILALMNLLSLTFSLVQNDRA